MTAELASRSLILLDLDGTISEPRVGIRNGYRAAFSAVGRPLPSDAEVDAWIGPPLREAFPRMGIPPAHVEDAVAAYREVYNRTGWLENELYPHMPGVVNRLAAGGPLALATAKPTGLATRILEHFELRPAFSFVGGASLDSSRDTKGAVIAHVLDELGSWLVTERPTSPALSSTASPRSACRGATAARRSYAMQARSPSRTIHATCWACSEVPPAEVTGSIRRIDAMSAVRKLANRTDHESTNSRPHVAKNVVSGPSCS